MNKLSISVFIIAKNEADRIDKPILSVRDWVDEVIVIDSGSDDGTPKVAELLGAKVVYNEWKGYGQQKIFGESLCRNDWLLNLDADEEISRELAENIRKELNNLADHSKNISAYSFNWKLLFINEEKPPLFAPGGKFIRLYNKKHAGFRDSTIHDSVVVREGNIAKIKGVVLHRCFRDLSHWTGKINYYSNMQAEDFVRKGRKVRLIRLLTEPFLAFIKSYFIRRYIVHGIDGFIASFQYAYAKFLRLAKARELSKKNERKHRK